MKKISPILILPVLLFLFAGCSPSSAPSADVSGGASAAALQVGVGKVDITPDEPVMISGSPFPEESGEVAAPLYTRAMVLSDGNERTAVITLDILKYPMDLAEAAMKKIEQETGIAADRITITSSHTHSGPYYTYYDGKLTDFMVEAVKSALADLGPCTVGAAKTQVTDISYNRRLKIDGEAWNDWLVSYQQARFMYPACGPVDPDLQLLAVIRPDGKYKAVLWNFACHATSASATSISSDYPGAVEEYLCEQLGYDVTALFLPGACGDISPANTSYQVGTALGKGIMTGLQSLEMIAAPTLSFQTTLADLPGREDPLYEEGAAEIAEKWPAILDGYKNNFDSTLAALKPAYKAYICAIRIGGDFAIVTNPVELFCSIGLNIKENSSFKYTMVAEQTNGAYGYMPAEQDFALKGYEVWFGEHSILGEKAGTVIQDVSIELLGALQAGQ